MTMHEYEDIKLWEEEYGKKHSNAVFDLSDDEEVYKAWVMSVPDKPDLVQIKILSIRRKKDGKIKMAIIYEHLDKTKTVYYIERWLTPEEFIQEATLEKANIDKEYPNYLWESVERKHFHFRKGNLKQ